MDDDDLQDSDDSQDSKSGPMPGPNEFSADEEQQMRQARSDFRAQKLANKNAFGTQMADRIATQKFANQRQSPPNTPNQ